MKYILTSYRRDLAWIIINIGLITTIILLLSSVIVSSNLIKTQVEVLTESSNKLIEVRPQRNMISPLELSSVLFTDSPLYTMSSMDSDSIIFFTKDDIALLEELPHVERVIPARLVYLPLFWGYEKCFTNVTTEYILNFFINQLASDYNLTYEKAVKDIHSIASIYGVSPEEYAYERAKGYFTEYHMALVINTSAVNDVLAYFNNVLEGNYIINPEEDILLSLDVTEIWYINYTATPPVVVTCESQVEVGDKGEIPLSYFGFSIVFGVNIPVRAAGIIPPNYVADFVMDESLFNNLLYVINRSSVDAGYDPLNTTFLNLYSLAYIVVDDPSNINTVLKEVLKKYPDAHVIPVSQTYTISAESIKAVESNLATTNLFVLALSIAGLFTIKSLELMVKRKDYALLKLFGWGDTQITLYFLVPSLLNGLISIAIFAAAYPIVRTIIIDILFERLGEALNPAMAKLVYALVLRKVQEIPLIEALDMAVLIGVVLIAVFTLIPLYYLKTRELDEILGEA